MFVPRAIRVDDTVEIKYRGVIYAGPVRYSGCSKLPGKPGYDLYILDFTNASTSLQLSWKPDIDEGAVLRSVTYSKPVCPTCNTRRHTVEIDNLTSYWQCCNCGYQGIADEFILDDTFVLNGAQLDRQDVVDDLIYDLICQLNPGETEQIDWDIEVIAEVRDAICDYFVRKGLTTEMDFYPYLRVSRPEVEDNDRHMDLGDALEIVIDLARQNVINDPDLADERARQELALDVVEDFIVNQFGED